MKREKSRFGTIVGWLILIHYNCCRVNTYKDNTKTRLILITYILYLDFSRYTTDTYYMEDKNMRATILENSMFDDGGVDCKTFVFATEHGAETAEWHLVQAALPYPEIVTDAIARGEHHVNVRDLGLTYGGELILEIQWD